MRPLDALWRLQKRQGSVKKEIAQVIPADLQEMVKDFFSTIGLTSYRLSVVKDLMIDHLGEESQEAVESLCALIDQEVGYIDDAPQKFKVTGWKVAGAALKCFLTPISYMIHLTIGVAYRAFQHYFPETDKSLSRLKIRLIAKAIVPFIFDEEQRKGFGLLLGQIENLLLPKDELSLTLKTSSSPSTTFTVTSHQIALSAEEKILQTKWRGLEITPDALTSKILPPNGKCGRLICSVCPKSKDSFSLMKN